jgi:hypothetical protein
LLRGSGRELKKFGPIGRISRFFGSEPSLTALRRWGRGTIGGGGCFKIIMGILGTISNMFWMVRWILVNFGENLCKISWNHVKIHEISWKIVTEINESLQETRYPKENLPEMIHSTKRFGYQKSQNVWSIEFLSKFFEFFKKLVKILIKMLG